MSIRFDFALLDSPGNEKILNQCVLWRSFVYFFVIFIPRMIKFELVFIIRLDLLLSDYEFPFYAAEFHFTNTSKNPFITE